MATASQISIVPMAMQHMSGALALSQAAGWPHRLEDWALLLEIGQGVVALSAEERVVGTAMGVRFGPVAMANMIIVDAAMRGAGLGRRLMEAAMQATEAQGQEPAGWRLVATPEGMPLYRKLGFSEVATVRQYQGRCESQTVFPARNGNRDVRWIDAPSPADLERIAAIDHAATFAQRRGLLERLATTGRFAVLHGADGQISGYGVLRPFGRGLTAGPIIAPTANDARNILVHMAGECTGAFLRVDTIAMPQETACVLADTIAALGLSEVGTGTEMHRRAEDAEPVRTMASGGFQRFVLASQALG